MVQHIETEIWGSSGERFIEKTDVNVYQLPPTGFDLVLQDGHATADKENVIKIILESGNKL
jgi:hypothetical protein